MSVLLLTLSVAKQKICNLSFITGIMLNFHCACDHICKAIYSYGKVPEAAVSVYL